MTRKICFSLFIIFFMALNAGAANEIRVQSVVGTAAVKQDDTWREVDTGEALKPPVEMRTAIISRLQVSLPGNSFIRFLPETTCRIAEAIKEGKETNRFRLEFSGGTIVLSTANKKNRMEVETPVGKKVKGTGLIFISVLDKERVMVSVLRGEACVTEEDKDICASSMQDMELKKKNGVEKPAKISDENLKLWKAEKFQSAAEGEKLFLKVLRPEAGKCVNQQNLFVTGNTLQGATVEVNGKDLEVRENGNFSGSMVLFEGQNQLMFTATAPNGETVSETRTVCLDTTPPLLMVSQPPASFDPTVIGNCDAQECRIQIFGLTEPGVLLTINGIDVSRFISDDGSFLIQDFPVRRTDTVLTIQAQDSLQQRSYEVLHIYSSE